MNYIIFRILSILKRTLFLHLIVDHFFLYIQVLVLRFSLKSLAKFKNN